MALTMDVHQINVSVYLGRKRCRVRSTDIDREPVPRLTRIPLRPVGRRRCKQRLSRSDGQSLQQKLAQLGYNILPLGRAGAGRPSKVYRVDAR
jgi:hypothetical protein